MKLKQLIAGAVITVSLGGQPWASAPGWHTRMRQGRGRAPSSSSRRRFPGRIATPMTAPAVTTDRSSTKVSG